MPAHWCIYKFMFYIHLIKYLFCISEYKAMLIQLLICHIYTVGTESIQTPLHFSLFVILQPFAKII